MKNGSMVLSVKILEEYLVLLRFYLQNCGIGSNLLWQRQYNFVWKLKPFFKHVDREQKHIIA